MKSTLSCILVLLFFQNAGSGMDLDSSKIILLKKSINVQQIENIFVDLSSASQAELSEKQHYLRFNSEQSGFEYPKWELNNYPQKIGIYFPRSESEKRLERIKESFPEVKKVYKHIDPKSFRFGIAHLGLSRGKYSDISSMRISLDQTLGDILRSSRGTYSLRKVPIIVSEYTDCFLQHSTSDNGPWVDLPYRIISGDCKVDLLQPYIFKASPDSMYQIAVSISLNGPSVLRKGWYAHIKLSENQSVIWDIEQIEKREYCLTNIADTIEFKVISPYILEWKVNQDMRAGIRFNIEKLPVKAAQPTKQSKIEIGISPDSTDWTYMSTSSQGIVVVNPSMRIQQFDENRNISMYSDGESFRIPEILFSQGEIPFINASNTLSITIPDSIPLKWNRTEMYLEVDKKYIEINPKVATLRIPEGINFQNYFRINGLSMQTPNQAVGEFELIFDLQVNKSNFKLSTNRKFCCGKPSFALGESQVILTSAIEPALYSLVLKEDKLVSVLGLNDFFTYSFPDSCDISFKKVHFDKIKINKTLVSITDDPSIPENVIKFKIEKELAKGDSILITNIPIDLGNQQTSRINCTTTFYSEFSDTFSIVDPHEIEIVNLIVEMSTSDEMIPYSKTRQNEFIIPSIKITNDSEIKVLENEVLGLTLDDSSAYSLNVGDCKLSRDGSTNIPRIRSGGRELLLSFDSGIAPRSSVTLSNVKIIFTPESKDIIKKPMKGVLKNKSNVLFTKNHITYGSPDFRTAASQYFINYDDKTKLYSFVLDFTMFPLVFERSDKILFKIPDSVNLSWDNNSKIILSQAEKKIFIENTILRDNQSVFELPFNLIRENGFEYSQIIKLEGLEFNSPIRHKDTVFNILISLDDGQSYAIQHSPAMKIVSSINRVEINRQRLYNDYFPFQKDRIIKIILDEKSGLIWNNSMDELHYSRRDIAEKKTKVFSSIKYSADNRTIYLKIEHDINHPYIAKNNQIYQYLDFGIPITLEQFQLIEDPSQYLLIRDNNKIPDMSIVYETAYGDINSIDYKSKYYSSYSVNSDKVSITLGLRDYPPSDELNDPHLIAWYRYRDQYLKYLKFNLKEDSSEKELQLVDSELERLNVELVRHYDIVQDEIDYDWVFWYYLAALKKRYEDIHGGYINKMQFSNYYLNTSDYHSDYEKAKRLGYDEQVLSAGFPKPIEGATSIILRSQEFARAWDLFKNEEYIDAETVVYENIDKPGFNEPYIKTANYALLGKIASALNDTTRFKDPYDDESDYNYECFVTKLANVEISQDQVRQEITNWYPDIITYLNENNCSNEEQPPYNLPNELNISNDYEFNHTIPINQAGLSIDYGSGHMAEVLGLQYLVQRRTWQVLPNNMLEYSNSEDEVLVNFGTELQIVGGNTYKLTFNPKSKAKTRTILTGCTGLLMIIWTLL